MDYRLLLSALEEQGLRSRGAFHPRRGDGVPMLSDGAAPGTLLLIGAEGGSLWPVFSASPEFRDGLKDPLDRWSSRVIGLLACTFGAEALFPFGGPPYHPFQLWAKRAAPLFPSPLGLLIDPRYGLWHAYRGALLFAELLAIPAAAASGEAADPCLRCAEQPCLSACPVEAFGPESYRIEACTSHLEVAFDSCAAAACLARAACPVGAHARYPEEQARFHVTAFQRSRRSCEGKTGER